jgi:hypothetical protein
MPIPLDAEGRSPFRAAVETKDFGQLEAVLATDVRFRSPVVFSPYEGRDSVGALLRVVGDVLAPELFYQWQVQEGPREVAELVVMMRPASALAAVQQAVAERLQTA